MLSTECRRRPKGNGRGAGRTQHSVDQSDTWGDRPGGVRVLDVAAADGGDAELADLAVFVDRLAEAGQDRGTARAHAQGRATIAAGSPPPGLRRLAEALAASVTELPPPRRPGDEAVSLVEMMRGTALAVLDTADPVTVAAAVG